MSVLAVRDTLRALFSSGIRLLALAFVPQGDGTDSVELSVVLARLHGVGADIEEPPLAGLVSLLLWIAMQAGRGEVGRAVEGTNTPAGVEDELHPEDFSICIEAVKLLVQVATLSEEVCSALLKRQEFPHLLMDLLLYTPDVGLQNAVGNAFHTLTQVCLLC